VAPIRVSEIIPPDGWSRLRRNIHRLPASIEGRYLDRTIDPLSLVRCLWEFTLGMLAYRAISSPTGQFIKSTAWVTYASAFAFLAVLCSAVAIVTTVLLVIAA
jgi:hypothetical protein